jgi:hypothetical protein
VRFPFGATRAKGILKLIHNYVFGLCTYSIVGRIYVLCLIYRLFIYENMVIFLAEEIYFGKLKEFKVLE